MTKNFLTKEENKISQDFEKNGYIIFDYNQKFFFKEINKILFDYLKKLQKKKILI